MRNNNFDLIRLLAALEVVIGHTVEFLELDLHPAVRPAYVVLRWFPGVPVFFTMSGYLLAKSLERNSNVATYARNRALRILPGLWFNVGATMALLAVAGLLFQLSPKELATFIAAQLTIGQTWAPGAIADYGLGAPLTPNSALWTIRVEIGFYIGLPILMLIGAKLFPRRRLLDLAIGVIAVASFVSYGLWVTPDLDESNLPAMIGLLVDSPAPFLWLFLAGVLIQRYEPFAKELLVNRTIYWLGIFLFARGAVWLAYESPAAPTVTRPNSWVLAFANLVLVLPAFAFAFSPSQFLARLRPSSDISYGIYLWHMLILGALVQWSVATGWLAGAAVVGGSVAAGYLSWVLVERPALNFKRSTVPVSPQHTLEHQDRIEHLGRRASSRRPTRFAFLLPSSTVKRSTRTFMAVGGVFAYLTMAFVVAIAVSVLNLRGGLKSPIVVHSASELTDPPTQVLPTPKPLSPLSDDVSTDALDTDPNVLFVSSDLGDDANDGQTTESPWKSLQRAMDQLQPGQTLLVMNGLYAEQNAPEYAHYQMIPSGTEDAWIHIGAAPGHDPILAPFEGNALEIQGSYVEVAGLTIRGETYDEDNAYGWGMIIRNTHHVRLQDNSISGMPVGGISAVESSNLEIYRNEVFHNSYWGTEQGSGISLWRSTDRGFGPGEDGYHDKIMGNIAYGNENKVFSRWSPNRQIITDGNGIIIDGTNETHYQGKILVANNVLFDNGGRGVITNLSSNVDIVFNTTFHNGRTPGLAGGAVEIAAVRSKNVRLLNNLAWALPDFPALAATEMIGLTIGGNVFITDKPTGYETADDLVTSDPVALASPGIDPATANFRPIAGSIVVDRAVNAGVNVGFDADGVVRPVSGADVGAYELIQ